MANTSERDEVERLRRTIDQLRVENAVLREENALLRTAAETFGALADRLNETLKRERRTPFRAVSNRQNNAADER